MKNHAFTRSLLLLLAVLALLSLCACGGSGEKVIDRPAQTEAAGSDAPMTAANAQAETEAGGYVFIHNGVKVPMDAEASAIVEALGEPASYFEAASCAFEGLDKMYTYGGFELDTYPTGDKDFVSAVILRDDSVATPEGVMIGDSAGKLQEVYGEPASVSGDLVTYEAGGMQLRFILEQDAVRSIEYISLAVEG